MLAAYSRISDSTSALTSGRAFSMMATSLAFRSGKAWDSWSWRVSEGGWKVAVFHGEAHDDRIKTKEFWPSLRICEARGGEKHSNANEKRRAHLDVEVEND